MTRYGKTMSDAYREVLLGEDNMDLMKKAAGGAMQTLKMKDGKLKMDSFTASAIMAIYKAVNDKNKKTMENLINTGNKAAILKLQKFAMSKINSGDELEHDGDELVEHTGDKPHKHPHEDDELEEGKMKELHALIKQGKSAEEIAKIMKVDAKTIKKLMPEGARADAMRAMRKDRGVDPADVDNTATDDDVKAASKNIIMQMRKVVSLRGNFKVEFGDKKKQKIDPKIAMAVQQKYDSLKKADDKEKFQNKIAKSYKDMLAALKESLDEEVKVKDFDALKKGDTITLDYKSAMSSGKGTFTVTAKNKVAKGKVEKVTLKNVKNPGGVKHFLYKRDDKVSFAQGDMGASVVGFKKEEVELDEKRDMSAPPVSAKVVEDGGFRLVMKFKDGTTEALPSLGKPSMQNLKQIVDKNILKNPKRKAWVSVVSAAMKKGPVKEEVELDEVFDFVLLDKDNKIAGRYSGKDAKKNAESGKKSAHMPPMNIPKGDVKKMKIVPIAPKDKKGIGDTVLAIGEAGWTDRKDPIPAGKELAKLMKKKKDKKEDVQEGTWGLPDTPKLMAGLKKLMQKPIPLGKDGDSAIKAIGKYIGDDGLYDDLYDAGKKDNPKDDARPTIAAWMDKEFVGSWKKYRLVGMGKSHSTIKEGTWAVPDDKKKQNALQKLMSKPLIAGKDGEKATSALYDLIGDDALFDSIYDVSRDDPTADVRHVVKSWLQKNDTWMDNYGMSLGWINRLKTESVLDRIDRKIKEKNNG